MHLPLVEVYLTDPDKQWGGELEIDAAANLYGVQIILWQRDDLGADPTKALLRGVFHPDWATNEMQRTLTHWNLVLSLNPPHYDTFPPVARVLSSDAQEAKVAWHRSSTSAVRRAKAKVDRAVQHRLVLLMRHSSMSEEELGTAIAAATARVNAALVNLDIVERRGDDGLYPDVDVDVDASAQATADAGATAAARR